MNRSLLWQLLALALLLRLISLVTYPLMDTTEARYGEMARLMVETGNWLTPQFDYGVPFWGKPPLFTWMSALGIHCFGVNEFAVRAPHWIAGMLTIALMGLMARKLGLNALVTALVLSTCGIFSIAAGAVMTDMALTLAMTLAMVGFYLCWLNHSEHAKRWGYAGFIGLACGLLAKGPLVLVLMGIAVVPWLVMQHGFFGAFKMLWQRFPLASGLLLMLAIALPWYVMAEMATPGFIDYFIVGEHFKRFLVSGWQGDLYGSAHNEPRGMIWLFWLQSALPWSLILPVLLWRRRKLIQAYEQTHPGLVSFLICWLIAPMLLFTLAGNVLVAYVLPGIPALGLLIAMLVKEKDSKWLAGVAAVLPVLLMVAMLVLNLGVADKRSDRTLFQRIPKGEPVFYVGKRPFSGQFYSQGQAKLLQNAAQLQNLEHYNLIGKPKRVDAFVEQHRLSCTRENTAGMRHALYHCQTD